MIAQQELIEHIKGRKVEFVSIAFCPGYSEDAIHIKGTLDEVLPRLNFKYDSKYGTQELYGYIWYEDGTWSDRGVYDGSEWWQHQTKPDRDTKISAEQPQKGENK